MKKSKDFGLLYKLNYPSNHIICNSLNSFIICGGGGGSYKSGIPNKVEAFDLGQVNARDSLALPILKNKVSFDTKDKLVTSIDCHFNYLVTADKNNLCEYIMIDTAQAETPADNDHTEDKTNTDSTLEFRLHRKVANCFVSDENGSENVVKYGGDSGSLIITGGCKGTVKIFQRYSDDKPMDLVLIKEIADVSDGTNCAVVDLNVSPNGDEFVSVCEQPAGKYARVWNISRGVKVTELALTSPSKKHLALKCAYKFKHCRYGSTYFNSDRRPSFLLYATHQPTKRDPKSPSFMSIWGPADPGCGTDYQLIDAISLGNNKAPFLNSTVKLVPSALAVSANGLLSSIGSGEGQVDVYRFNTRTSTLGLIYRLPSAHSFIVTDVMFMPSTRVMSTGHEFELLSIGVDQMVRYHRQPATVVYMKLEKLYSLLCLISVLFLCDRLLLVLNLF